MSTYLFSYIPQLIFRRRPHVGRFGDPREIVLGMTYGEHEYKLQSNLVKGCSNIDMLFNVSLKVYKYNNARVN